MLVQEHGVIPALVASAEAEAARTQTRQATTTPVGKPATATSAAPAAPVAAHAPEPDFMSLVQPSVQHLLLIFFFKCYVP